MVLMMLPMGFAELLEAVELEDPPRSSIELSINEEMIDCAESDRPLRKPRAIRSAAARLGRLLFAPATSISLGASSSL
jgi:hypothetical protein